MSRSSNSVTPSSPARKTKTASQPPDARLALSVEWWPIERPVPYGANPRIAPEIAIAKVAASLAAYGWRQPIVVDAGGVIVVGHTRLLAAQRLGYAQVPVHVATDLTAQQVKAYRLADNRIAEESHWDLDLLPAEIADLAAQGCDLDALGFSSGELAKLQLAVPVDLLDDEELPEPPAEPVTKLGDLWVLGKHRLHCGDATSTADVRRLMHGRRAALMATDPPYLINYDGGHHPQTWGNGGKTGKDSTRHWDAYTDHEHSVAFYRDFLSVALQEALLEAPAVYQWFAAMRAPVVFESWGAVGLLAHQTLIWAKCHPTLTHSHFMWDYEPCLYGWVQGHQPPRKPPADARAVWTIGSAVEDGAGHVHPTMKPLECFRRPIAYHTRPGELIYEPFCGSGTALLAAEQLGRVCYALECSPAFCDVIVERWQRLTGKEAVRHG